MSNQSVKAAKYYLAPKENTPQFSKYKKFVNFISALDIAISFAGIVEGTLQSLGLSAIIYNYVLGVERFTMGGYLAIAIAFGFVAYFLISSFECYIKTISIIRNDNIDNALQNQLAPAFMATLFALLIGVSSYFGGAANLKLFFNNGGKAKTTNVVAKADNAKSELLALQQNEAKEVQKATEQYDAEIEKAKTKKMPWRVDELMTAKNKAIAQISQRYEARQKTLSQFSNKSIELTTNENRKAEEESELLNMLYERFSLFITLVSMSVMLFGSYKSEVTKLECGMIEVDTTITNVYKSTASELKEEFAEIFNSIRPIYILLGVASILLFAMFQSDLIGSTALSTCLIGFAIFGIVVHNSKFKAKKN